MMNELKQIKDALEASKWRGEPSGNPEKGWVTDSRGQRFTSLGSRHGYGKFLDTHNKQIDYLIATLDRMMAAQPDVNAGLLEKLNAAEFNLGVEKSNVRLLTELSDEKDERIAELLWIKIKSMDDMPKKVTNSYEQYDCVCLIDGEIHHLVWNCEHEVFDDRSGDDYECDWNKPSHYFVVTHPKAIANAEQKGQSHD